MPVGTTRRWSVAALAASLLLGLLPKAGWSANDALTVSIRPAGTAVQIVLSAPAPFRFALRHLASPPRLVVDLLSLGLVRLSGAQEVNLAPVRVIRLTQASGLTQAIIELMEPVLADVGQSADGRNLTLTLRAQVVMFGRPIRVPVLPTEVVRLQYLRAREVAAHLQVLLPGLTARPDEATNSVLITAPADVLTQAKQLVAALDGPPATAAVTEVVPLRVLKAETLAAVLAGTFPQAQVRPETRLNAVVIVAPPALMARVKAVITALDVPPSPSPTAPTTEVVQLQHAEPVQVASLLTAVIPQTQVRVDPATRTLTVTASPPVLLQAKALVQQVDLPSPTAEVTEIVKIRAANPEAVAGGLRQAVPELTVTVDATLGALILRGPRVGVERAKTLLAALDAGPQAAPAQLRVEVIPLKHTIPSEFVTDPATSRSADDLAQTLLAALQPIYPELRIAVEKRLQVLIITGTVEALEAARALVTRLDLPSPQVALEVRVVEVAASALQNLGISLSPIVGTTFSEPDPERRPFTFTRTPLNIAMILNLLVERGQGKILASPTVATLDGRKALIRTGDDIPLVTRQIFGNTVIENVITFRAGVTLEILPKVSPEGTITVVLRPIVSTITGTTPQGAPQISTREVQTTVMVRDGETIVIGGLLEERDIVSMSQIPGLGALPFLGRLFRSERREQRRTELVITVTPRILTPSRTEPAP